MSAGGPSAIVEVLVGGGGDEGKTFVGTSMNLFGKDLHLIH